MRLVPDVGKCVFFVFKIALFIHAVSAFQGVMYYQRCQRIQKQFNTRQSAVCTAGRAAIRNVEYFSISVESPLKYGQNFSSGQKSTMTSSIKNFARNHKRRKRIYQIFPPSFSFNCLTSRFLKIRILHQAWCIQNLV